MAKADNKSIPILKPKDRGEARRLIALSALWRSLAVAREQDFVSWRTMGGPEAESLLHALDSGGDHPALQRWKALKATTTAYRPTPDPLDLEARRLILLMVEALRRTGLGEGLARRRAAEAVNPIFPTTKEAIRGWRRDYPAIIPDDGKLVAGAIKHYGNDPYQIINWFVVRILIEIDPIAARSAQLIPVGR